MVIEIENGNKKDVLNAIRRLMESESSGRIAFEKSEDGLSVFGSSEAEPISS